MTPTDPAPHVTTGRWTLCGLRATPADASLIDATRWLDAWWLGSKVDCGTCCQKVREGRR